MRIDSKNYSRDGRSLAGLKNKSFLPTDNRLHETRPWRISPTAPPLKLPDKSNNR